MNAPALADGVVIGICTFRRPLLAETLASLAGLAPGGPPVAVVVADNDVHPSDFVDLVVINFGKDQLLFDAEGVEVPRHRQEALAP